MLFNHPQTFQTTLKPSKPPSNLPNPFQLFQHSLVILNFLQAPNTSCKQSIITPFKPLEALHTPLNTIPHSQSSPSSPRTFENHSELCAFVKVTEICNYKNNYYSLCYLLFFLILFVIVSFVIVVFDFAFIVVFPIFSYIFLCFDCFSLKNEFYQSYQWITRKRQCIILIVSLVK